MRILSIIPARGGSKGIPRKNLSMVAGRPLIAYTLEAAQLSASLDRTVVSTEDPEIASVCTDLGAEVLLRPDYLATDTSSTQDVLLHVVEALSNTGYSPDAVMTLQPTSPLRSFRHIDEAVRLFKADPYADSLVSCVPIPHIFHPLSVMQQTCEGYLEPYFDFPQPTRRQDKTLVFARNGAAIYITRTTVLHKFIFGGRLIPYVMGDSFSLDVDTIDDLTEAERRLQGLCYQ
jgi:CMP-N,N'-diacetyllegionaminic acid synthase